MPSRRLPESVKRLSRWLRRVHPVPIILADLLAFVPGFWIAGLLRNELNPRTIDWSPVLQVAGMGIAMFIAFGWVSHLYRNRYRIATFDEVFILGCAWATATAGAVIVNLAFFAPRAPTSLIGMGMMITGCCMVAIRVVVRLVRTAENRPDRRGRTRVLVFGAGDGGASVVKSMLSDPDSRYVPVGLLDDDRRKRNRVIEGVRVVGTSDDIARLSAEAEMLLVAVPSADSALISRVAGAADEAGLDVMVLPSTTELFGMMVTIDEARPLEIADLLGRAEVEIDNESVRDYIADQVVLVTGAGGSIGSELARQIVRYEPRKLVMLDRDETALQALQLSLEGHGLLDDEHRVLADIRDRDRMTEVFRKCEPSIVFHAAALKHLPLLQSHPREGLLTNVIGTKNVLDAARNVGVGHFVNISTDKAANPTSVLGTTKRLAEALTVEAGARSHGDYISVRFGNVLASRGSVVPVFEAQIAGGGPVTVTHPEVTRFFMTIPEASRLVLQAGAIGTTGETLVLDMGEPMRIVDLANDMIRHYKSDAEIVFTGLRPNEKLHEELGHDGEVMAKKAHPRIWHTDAAVLGDVDFERLVQLDPDMLATELLEAVRGLRSRPVEVGKRHIRRVV